MSNLKRIYQMKKAAKAQLQLPPQVANCLIYVANNRFHFHLAYQPYNDLTRQWQQPLNAFFQRQYHYSLADN